MLVFQVFGEATANPFYNSTISAIEQVIVEHKELIEALDINTLPDEVWKKIAPYFKGNNFALCAVDEAYHDLFTKKRKQKLYEYWRLDIADIPLTSYTIGIDTIPNMIAKIKEKPWPIYKIKLGTADDVSIIKALRSVTNAKFIVDANASWTVEETLYNAKELKNWT